jgi:hypothetical protein
MKKGLRFLVVVLVVLSAMPVAARGSRDPAPSPAPPPPPPPAAPAYVDVPVYAYQSAYIPFVGTVTVEMKMTQRVYVTGGRREYVGSPAFRVLPFAAWPYVAVTLQPPVVERYANLVVWSQWFHCIRVDGRVNTPDDPWRGCPPQFDWYARVTFVL